MGDDTTRDDVEEEDEEAEEVEDEQPPQPPQAPTVVSVAADEVIQSDKDDPDEARITTYGETHIHASMAGEHDTNGDLDQETHYDKDGELKRFPLSWCNSANIRQDPDDDAVHVSISVGDPRGAFAMTIRRLDDGSLVMHVPYPGESMPHMKLTDLHPGTYRIGEQ